MALTACAKCGKPHPRCHSHRKLRDGDDGLQPCGRWPVRGLDLCTNHSGKTRDQAKEEGKRNLDRVEATTEAWARLGAEAIDEPIEVVTLREIRKSRSDLAVYQQQVDELIDTMGLAALAVPTGNPKKPNEVEKHFWLAWRDEERDRLMGWLAVARKLGIEEARLEHEQRISQAQGEQLATVIRVVVDGWRASLTARGLDAVVIEAVYREEFPGIARAAIEAARSETEGPA